LNHVIFCLCSNGQLFVNFYVDSGWKGSGCQEPWQQIF